MNWLRRFICWTTGSACPTPRRKNTPEMVEVRRRLSNAQLRLARLEEERRLEEELRRARSIRH